MYWMLGRVFVGLLSGFAPLELDEESFIRSPPFVLLPGSEAGVIVIPGAGKGRMVLDKIMVESGAGVLDDGVYVVEKPSVIDELEKFLWIVRYSWRDEAIRVVWAAAYIHLNRIEGDLAQKLSEYSGIPPERCLEVLGHVDRGRLWEAVEDRLRRILSRLPSSTHRKIMDYLCSKGRCFVEDVARYMVLEGLTTSTVYKVLSHLKKERFVDIVRYVRVSSRGPKRELLSPNCERCFYGFSSALNCLRFQVNELSMIIGVLYGRELGEEVRERLFRELLTVSNPNKVMRNVKEIIISFSKIRDRIGENGVKDILRKIDEVAGVKVLP